MRLTTRLPLLFIPLVAAPLVAVGLLAYVQLKHYSEDKAYAEVSARLSQVKTDWHRMAQSARANIELFSQDQQAINYLLAADEEERYSLYQRPLEEEFVNIQKVFPDYFELRLLMPDGFEDLRVTRPYIENFTEEEQDTALFQEISLAQQDVRHSLQRNPDTGKLTLYVSKRMVLLNEATAWKSTEASLRGYLVVSVDLSAWLEQIVNSTWAEGGGLVLTGPEGNVLVTAKRLESLGSELAGHVLGELPAAASDDHLHELQLSDMQVCHHYVQLDDGLFLHALLPVSELTAVGQRLASLVAAVLGIVLIIAIPLLMAMLRIQIIRPIQRLRKALKGVGEGTQRINLPIRREDEFGDLNRAFNQMSSKLQESGERVRKLAFRDTLTGLPNRLTFLENVAREMEMATRTDCQVAVLFLDLDNFKHINDTLGHQFGDRLLRDVAQRLSGHLRGYDWLSAAGSAIDDVALARLGGDEFTVLLSQLPSAMEAGIVAQRIIELLNQPIELNRHSYYVGASIGVAVFPGDGSSVDELIKHADLAMYEAKKQGKNNYQYFSRAISEQSKMRAQMDQKLHRAIEAGAFELFYQPIIDCRQQCVSYYEALIRWKDAELGYISPAHFIPLAEENGTINVIGDWVIEESMRQLNEWQTGNLPAARISINVSVVQLCKPDFAEHLGRAARARNITPDSVVIEVTETAVIQGKQDVIDTLSRLQQAGFKIALDDFGTGYSSLSYLTSLPIDVLKIDRSFIARVEESKDGAILSAIITMAHLLELEVVAEGIEEPAQMAYLNREGCHFVQGYLFCRPLPAQEVANFVLGDSADSRAALTA